MLQGYSLLEIQCDKCIMPKMSYEGEMVDCVVCPVLAKKAKKQLKAQMKLEAMKQEASAVRLEEQREPTEEKAQQEERTESTEALYTEEELHLLATLEEEAKAMAEAAEEAIRKAKAALENVSSNERGTISDTITKAERELAGESSIESSPAVEDQIGHDSPLAEDLIVHDIPPSASPIGYTIPASASYISEMDWDKRRADSRAFMTQRILAGWLVLNDFCEGSECYNMAMIAKDGQKECVVCGGSGTGMDGLYSATKHFCVIEGNDSIPDDGIEIVKTDLSCEAEEPSSDKSLQDEKKADEEKEEVEEIDTSKPRVDPPEIVTPAAVHETASEEIVQEKPAPKTFTFEFADDMPVGRPPRASPRLSSRGGLPPRSTSRSRMNGTVVIVGGPADFDNKSCGDMSRVSRAESVASDALDCILDQIELSKTRLANEDLSLKDQLATAETIEKLATAAVAMKKLEKLDL